MKKGANINTKDNNEVSKNYCTGSGFVQLILVRVLFPHHKKGLTLSQPCVAVPGTNRTLFRCAFRLHYHVRSAVTQNFR